MVSVISELKSYNESFKIIEKSQNTDQYCINLTIGLGTDFLIDYQKDLLQELWGDLQDLISDDLKSTNQIQKQLEQILHNFNTQLSIFGEKSKHQDYIDLRGGVQIWSNTYYIASLIWSSSLMIYRKQKLIHHIVNQISKNQKIALFSELVDGKINHNDRIIVLGWDISLALDEQDLNQVWSSLQEDYNFAQMMEDHVASRMDLKNFVYIWDYVTDLPQGVWFFAKYADTLWNQQSWISSTTRYILTNKIPFIIWWLLLLMWYLGRSIISLFLKQNPELNVNQNHSLPTIGEIRQDINQFKNIDPGSDSKAKLYQTIVSKLNNLEQANKRTNDVNELKKIINQEFFKWFKITTLTDNELKESYIYNFDNNDTSLWNPIKLLYHKSLAIIGSQGIRYGVVDNNYRGTITTFALPVLWCSMNILKNWYYCFDQLNNVTMINKGIQEAVSTKWGTFPSMIQDIATYGNTNMYILTKDPLLNAKGVYIVKYNNTLGSQKDFLEGKEYVFDNTSGTNIFTSWFSSLAIDSTFLLRSPDQKKLYQFWREKNSDIVNSRTPKLIWWNPEYKPLSSQVKVIATTNSAYIYLFDQINQTLTIYNSSPNKTNENNTSSFNLQYLFRFDISSKNPLIDMVITDNDKPMLYGLTKTGVLTIKLHEFIESYKHTNWSTASWSGLLME